MPEQESYELDNESAAVCCSVCFEPLEYNDFVHPVCRCNVPICAFCREDLTKFQTDKCPGCRAAIDFSSQPALDPLRVAEWKRIETAENCRKNKDTKFDKVYEQRNGVFIDGLPISFTSALLLSPGYLPNYGTVQAITLTQKKANQTPVYSAHVVFSSAEEAQACATTLHGASLADHPERLHVRLATCRLCPTVCTGKLCKNASCTDLHVIDGTEVVADNAYTRRPALPQKWYSYENRFPRVRHIERIRKQK